VTWQPINWWQGQVAYSYLQIQQHRDSGSNDVASERRDEGRSPRHQVSLRSALDITHSVDLDCMLRFVDHLPSVSIPSYMALDMRLAYRLRHNLELAIVGQNLLDSHHPEFLPGAFGTLGAAREIERSIYGKVVWRN